MSEIIEKISSYNLFNYLLPGVVMVAFLNNQTLYTIPTDDLLILAFLAYFIGLTVSRVGSVIVEPFLKKIKVLKFREYSDFITASQKDEKINTLSEQNNMYRTIVSMLVIMWLLKVYVLISKYYNFWEYDVYIFLLLLCVLFILAYIKQTKYITSRIDRIVKN